MTTAPGSRKSQCAAAKREAEGIRKCPQLFHAPYVVEWATPAGFHRAKPPVSGAASVPGEARNAAARAFFSYTIKRRILFFLSRKKRMGVLKPAAFAAPSRAPNGAHHQTPARDQIKITL